MDTNHSPGDGPPIPSPGADTGSPPVPQPFEKEKSPVATTVNEHQAPLHQTPTGSAEAQPASSNHDLSHPPADSSEENLLKLQDQLRQEGPGTRSTLTSVKNEESLDKHFSGMGEGSHSPSADVLGDVEMPDATANDVDDSEAEGDNEDDSDFHSQSDSDSDSSENAGRRGKHRLPKAGTESSSQVSAFFQSVVALRDSYFTKKTSEGLTDNEHQMLEQLEKQIADAQNQGLTIKKDETTQKKKKERRKPATTAREYWRRELEEEAEKEAEQEEKKRKCEGEDEAPNKSQKTAAESQPKQRTKGSAASARASMLQSLCDMDQKVNDGTLPTMGAIQARTHADQMKQIMKGIPDGCDTRRSRTQAKDVEQAKSSFGYKKVEAFDGTWKLKGMTTGLLNYQIVVSAWMAKREAQELHPAGGLVADDMGMGKTITTIGCIVGHPPEKEDLEEFSRATLVVVNNRQNATQWSEQIEKHCCEKFYSKTDIFDKNRPRWDAKRWGKLNVVITTYPELVAQFPNKAEMQALREKYPNNGVAFEKALHRKLGKIFKVNWYRVILDEAHTIKNRSSSTTLACWQLSAKFRWVASGTPLFNTVEEFYPYLRFLGCSFAVNLKRFREEYLEGIESNDNFEALVSLIMYRRTQNESFMGHLIVPLPKSHSQDLWVYPEEWEMGMIRAVNNPYEKGGKGENNENDEEDEPAAEKNEDEQEDEDRPEETGQAFGSADEEEKDVAEAQGDTKKPQSEATICRTRFIRLRQAVSHPLNLEIFLREEDREAGIRSATERFKEEIEAIQKDADKAKARAEQVAQDKAGREKFSTGAHQIETRYKDWIGGAEEMAKLRALAANEHEVREVTCGFCQKKKPPVDPTRNANCKHIFCESCIMRGISKASGLVKVEFTCPVQGCSATLGMGESLTTPACIKESLKNAKVVDAYKEPGRDSIGTQWSGDRDGCTSFFLATCGRRDIDYGPVKMPWGSKIKATMEVILTWLKEAPDDKMIVFVEFTRTSKALGCILEKMDIDFLYYNRMAKSSQKDKALEEFRENPDQKILLASMKCGGQALDLPVANRVIIVDLWYNKMVEQQAFKRVHRFGQKKETHLVRILARDTIDERLHMLQNAKETVVNRALQDDGHLITFSEGQSLRWLFSDQDVEGMKQGLDAEAKAKKSKGKGKKKA